MPRGNIRRRKDKRSNRRSNKSKIKITRRKKRKITRRKKRKSKQKRNDKQSGGVNKYEALVDSTKTTVELTELTQHLISQFNTSEGRKECIDHMNETLKGGGDRDPTPIILLGKVDNQSILTRLTKMTNDLKNSNIMMYLRRSLIFMGIIAAVLGWWEVFSSGEGLPSGTSSGSSGEIAAAAAAAAGWISLSGITKTLICVLSLALSTLTLALKWYKEFTLVRSIAKCQQKEVDILLLYTYAYMRSKLNGDSSSPQLIGEYNKLIKTILDKYNEQPITEELPITGEQMTDVEIPPTTQAQTTEPGSEEIGQLLQQFENVFSMNERLMGYFPRLEAVSRNIIVINGTVAACDMILLLTLEVWGTLEYLAITSVVFAVFMCFWWILYKESDGEAGGSGGAVEDVDGVLGGGNELAILEFHPGNLLNLDPRFLTDPTMKKIVNTFSDPKVIKILSNTEITRKFMQSLKYGSFVQDLVKVATSSNEIYQLILDHLGIQYSPEEIELFRKTLAAGLDAELDKISKQYGLTKVVFISGGGESKKRKKRTKKRKRKTRRKTNRRTKGRTKKRTENNI